MDSNKDSPNAEKADKKDGPPTSLPDDLKPLPKPDGFKKLPPSTHEPGGTFGILNRAKQGKEKSGKRGCGCGSLIIFTILMIIGVSVGGIAWLIQPFNKADFAQQRAASIETSEAPTENTLFLSPSVSLLAASTQVEVGAIAGTVTLEGTFSEDVYVRAFKVYCAPGTTFEKDLDVIAFDYVNEGIIVGELKGRIVRQKESAGD